MIQKITRKEYNLIAEQRGIKDPQNMSKEELLNILVDIIVSIKQRRFKNPAKKLK